MIVGEGFSLFSLFFFLFSFFFFFFFFLLLTRCGVGCVGLRLAEGMQNKPAEDYLGTEQRDSCPQSSCTVLTQSCTDQDTASAWPGAREATGEGQLRNTSQLFTLSRMSSPLSCPAVDRYRREQLTRTETLCLRGE